VEPDICSSTQRANKPALSQNIGRKLNSSLSYLMSPIFKEERETNALYGTEKQEDRPRQQEVELL
jgi:hypothetical protein